MPIAGPLRSSCRGLPKNKNLGVDTWTLSPSNCTVSSCIQGIEAVMKHNFDEKQTARRSTQGDEGHCPRHLHLQPRLLASFNMMEFIARKLCECQSPQSCQVCRLMCLQLVCLVTITLGPGLVGSFSSQQTHVPDRLSLDQNSAQIRFRLSSEHLRSAQVHI